NGTGNLTWTVADNGTPAQTLTENLAITVTPVNDMPVRTAGMLTPISVAENSANGTAVTLGLSGVTYGPGGGADEAGQTLTYMLTAIPAYVQIFNGATQVLVNGTVSGTELQNLKYKTLADANGTGNLTWTVTDSGSGTGPNVNRLTENLAITVNAFNDAPLRTAGTLMPMSMREDSAIGEAGTLGLSGLGYSPGGGTDESLQTLTYQVTAIPSFITIWSGAAQVTAGATTSLAGLRGLTYKTVPDANGTGNLTWTVADNGTPVQTLTENLAITVTAVNDVPVRTAGTLTPISVTEDSANSTAVTLGLSGLGYGPGGGADESPQTLTYQVTGIPMFITVWNGAAPVTAGTLVSLGVLQELTYQTMPDANGAGNLTWTVTDNGTTNEAADPRTLTETLAITVTAVNDVPVRTAGTVTPISVPEDSANSAQMTLGLNGLGYGRGGGSDESVQTLTYRVAVIPPFITVWNGAAQVTTGATLSLAGLQGLKYKTVPDANGTGNLTWTVADNGTPVQTLTENLALTVTEVNDAPTGVNDGLTAVAEDSGTRTISFASLVTNDLPGPANESGQTLTITAVTSAVGGVVAINGTNVEFTPAANFNGPASFVYTLQDNGTTNGVNAFLTSTATVSFTVTGINVSAISGPTTESGGTATFTVTLASQPSGNVTIPLTSSDLTEGTVAANVTITPTQWQTGVQVTVTGVDDVIIDGNVAYTILTGDPTSTDATYDA
ncbi:MAG: Ig-like domain-containing protein, partial [Planctomycetota bacterium]|nr:Ig-like domain-containing protein [Planctomycetota bacterium]